MLAALLVSLVLSACGSGERHQSAASYEVTGRFPHDPTAYTQGLVWADSILFESTGQYGHSELRRVDLRSGRVLASRPLTADRFGEGLALLIMSDGSDSLRILSPATFQVQRVVHVRYNGAPLYQLNELEYVNGEVLANVYQSNWVMRIDPATGTVREAIDFADLYPERPSSAEVMNGIALAPDGSQLLLTGKLWPVLFQVRLGAPQSHH